MSKKPPTIIFGDEEYELEKISVEGRQKLMALKFAITRIDELKNQQFLLQRAKNGYLSDLKAEMIASKSGLLFGDS